MVPVLHSLGCQAYAKREMIKVWVDVELKDTIVVAMPKLTEDRCGLDSITNSSGSSFWNVETSNTSTTPIVDKIGKLEKQIIDGEVNLVDDNDSYDDDMYEGQDIPDKIQDICDNLDIRVRGRRKK
ncbi:hypothetical protein Tco_0698501 [Tanacetum coccineum]